MCPCPSPRWSRCAWPVFISSRRGHSSSYVVHKSCRAPLAGITPGPDVRQTDRGWADVGREGPRPALRPGRSGERAARSRLRYRDEQTTSSSFCPCWSSCLHGTLAEQRQNANLQLRKLGEALLLGTRRPATAREGELQGFSPGDSRNAWNGTGFARDQIFCVDRWRRILRRPR